LGNFISSPCVSYILIIFNLSEQYKVVASVTETPTPSFALLFSGNNKAELIRVLFHVPAFPIFLLYKK